MFIVFLLCVRVAHVAQSDTCVKSRSETVAQQEDSVKSKADLVLNLTLEYKDGKIKRKHHPVGNY